MKSRIDLLVECLRHGIIPLDEDDQKLCAKIVMICVSLMLYADEHQEEMVIHVMDLKHRNATILGAIHEMWTKPFVETLANKTIKISEFTGAGAFAIDEGVDLYAAYKRLVLHTCRTCKEIFTSKVNCVRCEASHRTRKDLSHSKIITATELLGTWDELDMGARRELRILDVVETLRGCSTYTDNVQKLVDFFVLGADILPWQLLDALETVSEGTFTYAATHAADAKNKMAAACVSRSDVLSLMAGDLVAAIAGVVLARKRRDADLVAQQLLLSDAKTQDNQHQQHRGGKKKAKKAKKKKTTAAKKNAAVVVVVSEEEEEEVATPASSEKKGYYDSDDILRGVEESARQYADVLDAYSKEAFMVNLERRIFGNGVHHRLISWADEEDY